MPAYLFVATSSFAWGEVVFARRIAMELRASGARVILLAPSKLGPLLEPTQWDRLGYIDRVLPSLPATIVQVAHSERCDTVVLVDIASVFMQLEAQRADGLLVSTLQRAGLRVVGLDVWNLQSTTMRWDFGFGREWIHSRHTSSVRHRLCPVPFVSTGAAGAYRALTTIASGDRRRARAAFGVCSDERLVVFPTATWQEPENQNFIDNARIARGMPRLLGGMLSRVDSRIRVAHVGPNASSSLQTALGERYRFHAQMSASEFEQLVLAADVLVTANLAATTISTALAVDVPVLAIINSYAGKTVLEIEAQHSLSQTVRDDVATMLPIDRFRVWPMGLFTFLGPVLEANAFVDAIEVVELLDEPRFTTTLLDLIGSGRERALDRQRAYRARVLALPSASELLATFS